MPHLLRVEVKMDRLVRLYRCLSCTCAFAIFLKRGKENKGGKSLSCPLCQETDVEEVDTVHEPATLLDATIEKWAGRRAAGSGYDFRHHTRDHEFRFSQFFAAWRAATRVGLGLTRLRRRVKVRIVS